jgi:hypothetical protein
MHTTLLRIFWQYQKRNKGPHGLGGLRFDHKTTHTQYVNVWMMGKAQWVGDILKMHNLNHLLPCPKPLILGRLAPWGFTLHLKHGWYWFSMDANCWPFLYVNHIWVLNFSLENNYFENQVQHHSFKMWLYKQSFKGFNNNGLTWYSWYPFWCWTPSDHVHVVFLFWILCNYL